ncbi:MAG: hypothetical protein ACRD29_08115 [Acidimicrobiales bacterium]
MGDHEAERGSAKLLAAWTERRTVLTDDDLNEIAGELEQSPARVEDVRFFGGSETIGLAFSLAYHGDDVDWCGNDLGWLLRLKKKFGGYSNPPVVIINGTPWPDFAIVAASFGEVPGEAVDQILEKRIGR